MVAFRQVCICTRTRYLVANNNTRYMCVGEPHASGVACCFNHITILTACTACTDCTADLYRLCHDTDPSMYLARSLQARNVKSQIMSIHPHELCNEALTLALACHQNAK
jgi:hypothetical protein